VRWFDRHLDASLEPWAQGELTSSRATRLLRHAHTCERCGRLYEQWARAHRMLENRDVSIPTSAEGAALMASGLEAALAAAAPPMRVRWPALVPMLGTVAVACVVLLMVRPFTPSEEQPGGGDPTATGTQDWQSRGMAIPEPGAVLRVFCAAPGRPLRELVEQDTCPPGAQLAFAAGAESPLAHVAVKAYQWPPVRERPRRPAVNVSPESQPNPAPYEEGQEPKPRAMHWQQLGGPFLLGGKPGQEVPLEWTLRLPAMVGEVRVEAVFAPDPATALHALAGPRDEGKAVLRRLSIRLQEAP
jgi:hypothetical protein